MSTDLHPSILWAQRADCILLTISIQDAVNVSINLRDHTLNFSGESEGKSYKAMIPLYKEVIPEESSHVVRPRQIELKIKKSDVDAEFWPRLTKEKTKSSFIQIDWNRWKDEDEDTAKEDLGDFGLGGPMGGGGFGSMMGGGAGGLDMDMLSKLSAGGGLPGFGSARGQEAKGIPDDLVEDEEMPPLED